MAPQEAPLTPSGDNDGGHHPRVQTASQWCIRNKVSFRNVWDIFVLEKHLGCLQSKSGPDENILGIVLEHWSNYKFAFLTPPFFKPIIGIKKTPLCMHQIINQMACCHNGLMFIECFLFARHVLALIISYHLHNNPQR